MDFIPVGTLIGGNIIKAQIASDVFHSSIKIGGLAIYTLYVALRKPLNETLKKLDEEYAENILPKITAFNFCGRAAVRFFTAIIHPLKKAQKGHAVQRALCIVEDYCFFWSSRYVPCA